MIPATPGSHSQRVSNPLEPVIDYLVKTENLKLAENVLDVFYSTASNLMEFDFLGKMYHDAKAYQKSLAALDKCIELTENEQQAFSVGCNRIKLYNHINRPDLALCEIEKYLEDNPKSFDMNMEKAFALFLLNRKDESEAIFRELITWANLNPTETAKIKFNLGTYDLVAGKFHEGLKGFLLEGKKIGLWKKKDIVPAYKHITKPFSEFKPETLYIIAEGGYGDEFINIRFLKHLQDMSINAVWITSRKDVYDIINRLGFKSLLNPDYTKLIKEDVKFCYSMSLPIWLELTPEELWNGPYFSADESLSEKFEFMKEDTNFRIGLKWSGNPYYEHDLHRSINISAVYSIIKEQFGDSASLYNLQLEITEQEKSSMKDLNLLEINNYDDTLTVMKNLDLVITSCTSVAHAAAALGTQVIILIPISAYYTWDTLREDGTSQWYGKNVTLIFQEEYNNWNIPIEKLKSKLLSITH